MIIYIQPIISLETLRQEMRDICKFSINQDFTMKWIDEEGNLFFHFSGFICFDLLMS